MKALRFAKAATIALGMLVLTLACNRRSESPSSGQARPAVSGRAATPSRPAQDLGLANTHAPHATPVELLSDASSAYTAGLVVDADAIYVLTDRAAYRVVPGASPQRIPIENGATAAVTRSDLIYWSKGAIWRISKTGGEPRRLAALEQQPAFFMAAGDELAWLSMPVRDEFVIQTLDGQRVRTLYYHRGRIEAAAMDAGRVFFVGRGAGTSWRIGSVSVPGGEVAFTGPKTGPTPAKLAVAGDIFYYDLDSGELRRLSADLSREEALTKDVICSPVAVAAKIYCPNLQGLFELPRQPGAKATLVFPEPRRIPAVAASSRLVVWLADSGADRLSLMMTPVQ